VAVAVSQSLPLAKSSREAEKNNEITAVVASAAGAFPAFSHNQRVTKLRLMQ